MAGEIARTFTEASRPGISRHLRVLRECGVIDCQRAGKSQLYTLDLEPLAQVRDGWLARFGTMQAASLRALRAAVEAGSPRGSGHETLRRDQK